MTDTHHGGTPADAREELDALWGEFEHNLAAYLVTMTDPNEADHLLVELAGPDSDDGCPPYAQFAGFGDGAMIRAEVSGDAYLLPQYRLGEGGRAFFAERGWTGNAEDDADDRNWSIQVPLAGVARVAETVVWALRRHFGVAHPELLTYQAWGPAAEGADALGLCATDDVPVAEVPSDVDTLVDPLAAQLPVDREELLAFVAAALREKYDVEPTLDDDGDFVLHHLDQQVWVRVRADQPAVEVFARVAHGVHSRRATAVELGLLNRDNLWVRWTERDRAIWQTLMLPGLPFVPAHLDGMLDLFAETMSSTRDDLAYRTGARVA